MPGSVVEAGDLWEACATVLRDRLPESTWKTWLQTLHPLSLDGNRLVLTAPNPVAKDRVESRYLSLICDILNDIVPSTLDVSVEVDPSVQESPDDIFAPPGIKPDTPNVAGRIPVDDLPLNTGYTFETFVIGESNRFAHAAALSVAEAPAKSYNPLFIYGRVGLGKTHLLHAIGHYVRHNYPDMYFRYVTMETFLNEFVDAIRTNSTNAFKRRYRECHLLLIDDVQFIENKERVQEEFFHTFNYLHSCNRQIVLSADRAPKLISSLEDRLLSRFEWGLITDVQPPDLETRMAILRTKAERDRVRVPDEVLTYIATEITDNIRKLEGALNRVSAFSSLNNRTPTIDLAREVLVDLVSSHEPRTVTSFDIIEATSDMFGLSVEDLRGKSRSRPLVTARQIAMYVFRELTDFSYPAIGREFGNRDHTTVMHAVDKIGGLMKERRATYDQVTQLIGRLRSRG